MARRHVLLALCFLLSASVTFLQQMRLIQASTVVPFQPGEGHSNSEGGSRREGVTIPTDNAISESGIHPVSKGSHGGYTTDSGKKAAHTSTNGTSGSAPTRHAGSSTGDDSRGSSLLDGPLRPTTSIQSNATTIESTGSRAPPRSLTSSTRSGPTTAEEEVAGEGRINNRSGVWVPNAVEEDTLSGHREITEKEANSKANDTEEEYGDILDLTIEGQPLATEESKDALNFSDVSEEAGQAPLPRSKSVGPRLSSSPEELSEQFFTAKESLFESLYERARNQAQEEEETKLQQQQQSDEQQQHHFGSVLQQRVQPGQPHASGGSHAVSITEDFPRNRQPTDEPTVTLATPRGATSLRLKAASFVVSRKGSKHDSAHAGLRRHPRAAAGQPESGDFQENATNGAPATTTHRGITCSRPRSLSLPATAPEAPDKRADDGGRKTSNASKAAEQGQAETHTVPDSGLTTASAVKQRRPPPLRLGVQEDSPGAAEERDMQKSPLLQKDGGFATPAPAAEGVNDNAKAATENGKHQAAPAGAQQQQSKGAEGDVSAPTQDNTEISPQPSVEGTETAKQQVQGLHQPQAPQQQGLLQEGEKQKGNLEKKGSKADGQTRKATIPTVFAARRMAERWEPCGRWTNYVFIFVNPLSGDGSGAQWVSRVDSHGHYQTSFRDICTRVHLYNLRHGAGGAPAGFQLLQRIAAAKHVLSVAAAGEAKLMSLKSLVPAGLGTPTLPVSGNKLASSIHGAAGAGAAAAGGRAGAGDYRHSHMRAQALVRAIAVGGDGTVSWVNRAASEAGVRPEWIAIGVVGFGTGNDFAQSYGWGNTEYAVNIFKGDLLKQYVMQWQAAQVAPHDVWRVNVKTLPNGYFEHIDSSTRTFKKILSETTLRPSTVLSGYMTLYFGIGFEALLGLTFDMSRSTSRLRNRMLYGFAFFKHFNKPWRLVTDQIESVYVFEDNQKKVLFTTNPVKYSLSFRLQPAISITFLGTETILGGIKMWAHSRRVGVAPPLQDSSYFRRKYETFVRRLINVRQDMGDQKLELMSFRDRFSLMRSVMYEQNAASRLMQHRGPFYVKFYPAKISGPVPFQVDGEFFLGHNVVGAEVKYETTFYVLKHADRRSPISRVTDILDAFTAGEKRPTHVDRRLFSRSGLWGP